MRSFVPDKTQVRHSIQGDPSMVPPSSVLVILSPRSADRQRPFSYRDYTDGFCKFWRSLWRKGGSAS
jgi:hypothetical protein